MGIDARLLSATQDVGRQTGDQQERHDQQQRRKDLSGQPLPACPGKGPGERRRSLLEFPGHERRAHRDADEEWQHVSQRRHDTHVPAVQRVGEPLAWQLAGSGHPG